MSLTEHQQNKIQKLQKLDVPSCLILLFIQALNL